MKPDFTKGLIKGIAYYVIGFISAYITYLLFGWEYKHAPALYHLVAGAFLLVGAVWSFYYFVLLLTGFRAKVNFGLLTVHITVILSLILYLLSP